MSFKKTVFAIIWFAIWIIILNMSAIPFAFLVNLIAPVKLATSQVFLALFITWLVWLICRVLRRPQK